MSPPLTVNQTALVILNWNGHEDTLACLESVLRLKRKPRTTVIVDNGSTDSSVQAITAWAERRSREEGFTFLSRDASEPGSPDFGDRGASSAESYVVLIRSSTNRGFARGNNLGIEYVLANDVLATHVLVLNNDTLLHRDSVEIMASHFDDDAVGLVGPRVLDYYDGSEWQWPVKGRLDFATMLVVFSGLNRILRGTNLYRSRFCMDARAQDVYAVPGSCMIFSRRAVEDLRGFDPATFLYWEEFIVAERLRSLSYRTRYAPEAHVLHKLGASTKKLGSRRYIENVRSEAYFLRTYTELKWWHVLVIQSLKALGYAVRCLGSRDYRANAAEFVRALVDTRRLRHNSEVLADRSA